MSRHIESNIDNHNLVNFKFVTQILVSTYLECQFSGWANHDGLNAPLAEQVFLTEPLSDGEAEGECLS